MAGRSKESMGMPCFRVIRSKSFSFKVEGLRSDGSSIIVEGLYSTKALFLWGLSSDELLSDTDECLESWAAVDGPATLCSDADALDNCRVVTIFTAFLNEGL